MIKALERLGRAVRTVFRDPDTGEQSYSPWSEDEAPDPSLDRHQVMIYGSIRDALDDIQSGAVDAQTILATTPAGKLACLRRVDAVGMFGYEYAPLEEAASAFGQIARLGTVNGHSYGLHAEPASEEESVPTPTYRGAAHATRRIIRLR